MCSLEFALRELWDGPHLPVADIFYQARQDGRLQNYVGKCKCGVFSEHRYYATSFCEAEESVFGASSRLCIIQCLR